MSEEYDDELENEEDGPEEEGDEKKPSGVIQIKFTPEDIDSIFDAVYNGVSILQTIMANIYKNYQQKVIDYDDLKTEVDTKDAELKKYKDKLLEIYSEQAPKQTKRKVKDKNEL